RRSESGGAIRRAPTAALALALSFRRLEEKADELFDTFGIGLTRAGDAMRFGHLTEHEPPARECVRILHSEAPIGERRGVSPTCVAVHVGLTPRRSPRIIKANP